jgi:iron(III) transport system permease protein
MTLLRERPAPPDDAPPRNHRPPLPRRLALRLRTLQPFEMVTVGVALLFIAAIAYPCFRILRDIFYTDGEFGFAAFSDFAAQEDSGEAVLNTVIVVFVSAAISIVIGGALAWLNERTDMRMGGLSYIFPVAPFIFPAIATSIGWVFLLSDTAGFINYFLRNVILDPIGIHLATGPININTMYGLIFLYVIADVPYAFMLITAGLRSMDSQLEEQSWMCGVSPATTVRRIVLRAMGPSLAGAFLITVWSGFGKYAVPAAIAAPADIPIMSVSIVHFLKAQYPPSYGAAVIMSVIKVAFIGIVWYSSRRVSGSTHFAHVSSKSRATTPHKLGKLKWPIRVGYLLYCSLGTILPIVALLLVAMNGYWTPRINWANLNFRAFNTDIFSNATTYLALKDSFSFGLVVASVTIFVAGAVSLLLTRRRGFVSNFVDGALKLPVILSWVVLALGFILAFAGPPFNLVNTIWILLIAYLALMMPLATVVTDPAAAQVGAEFREASELSGARSFRTYLKVSLPLMATGMAAAWGLVFVRVIGDLEISALLAGPGTPTIGSQTLALYTNGQYAGVSALSLILIVLTLLAVMLAALVVSRLSKWNRVALSAPKE